ncbi:MAG: UDP-glucose 4-epimerase [Syntrophus sp. SKADARSKE-3]|nr:UDP-glucose 4-epimerase [Syntrophus sp. SKADARSKE-3]
MQVLITGGAGFLGINLVRYLLAKGIESIVVLDIADFDYADVKDKVIFVKGDIRHGATISQCLPDHAIVVNAAAALPLYQPEDIFSTEVEGLKNLLEESLKKNADRVIHISSTAVYGVPDHHPILETDRLDGIGPYGKAKVLAEGICRDYRQQGLCIPILRPKSFVGPERLGVFAILYDWALDGRNFPLIGKGENRYQLLDVEDLCEAIWLCMVNDKSIVNDTFNIAAKQFRTMREDFQAVIDAAGHGRKVVCFLAWPATFLLSMLAFMNLSPLYPWIFETASKDSFVSISKAENILGYSPRYSNRDALIRNFTWYREHRDQFKHRSGITHRVPWNQGVLKILKLFF